MRLLINLWVNLFLSLRAYPLKKKIMETQLDWIAQQVSHLSYAQGHLLDKLEMNAKG